MKRYKSLFRESDEQITKNNWKHFLSQNDYIETKEGLVSYLDDNNLLPPLANKLQNSLRSSRIDYYNKYKLETLLNLAQKLKEDFKKWDKKQIGFVVSKNIYNNPIVLIPNFGNITKGKNFLKSLEFENYGNPVYWIYKRNTPEEIIMHYNKINGNWHSDNSIEDFINAGFLLYEV